MSDFWDSRYAEAAANDETVWSLEPNAWIASVTRELTPAAAVDLGAGEGRNALWLASLGWKVTAVDFSSVGLDIGRSRAQSLGLDIEWVTADATAWVSPSPVDLAVMSYLQLTADATSRALRNAAASLARGGLLAVIGHDRDNLERGVGGPRDPELLYTVEGLAAAASGLDVLDCSQFERETAAGVAIDTILLARKS
jgi:SAM-dependent methyltransferase